MLSEAERQRLKQAEPGLCFYQSSLRTLGDMVTGVYLWDSFCKARQHQTAQLTVLQTPCDSNKLKEAEDGTAEMRASL